MIPRIRSWIQDVIAPVVTDGFGVPQGQYRNWTMVGFTIVADPAGKRLVITAPGGSSLVGPGGSIDVSGGGVAIASVGAMAVSAPAVTFNAPVSMAASTKFSQSAAPTVGDDLTNKTYVDGAVGAGVPSAITNNASITGPGAIAISPAAGSALSATATAAGSVVVSAAGTSPAPNAGDVRIRAEAQVRIEAIGAAGGVAIRAGAASSNPGVDGVVVEADATLVLAAPTTQILATALTANGARITGTKYARLATTAADSLSGLAARDGVTPVAGDRVFEKDAAGASRGIYVAAAGAWARAADWASGQTLDSGTIVHVAAGTANGGKSWRVTNAAAVLVGTDTPTLAQFGAGGGGSSITDGIGSLALDGSGNLTTTGAASVAIDATTTATYRGGGGLAGMDVNSDGTEAEVFGSESVLLRAGASNAIVRSIGGTAGGGGATARVTESISGAAHRTVIKDAAGNDAITVLADDAASSITAVGTLAVTCATSLTETVGSASRTVTSSGAATTCAYGGSLTTTVASGCHMTFTVPENCTTTTGNNYVVTCSNNLTIYGANLCNFQVGTTKRRITHGTSAVDHIDIYFAADTTVADAATVTLATLVRAGAKAGGKPIRVRYDVLAWDAAGNVTTREVKFTMRRNGANGVIVGTPYISTAADDAVEIASLTVTVVDDAAGVLTRLANASGGSVDACIVGFEVYR